MKDLPVSPISIFSFQTVAMAGTALVVLALGISAVAYFQDAIQFQDRLYQMSRGRKP